MPSSLGSPWSQGEEEEEERQPHFSLSSACQATVTQARTRLCESMRPDTMAQRTDIGKENEQDGVKGLEQLYLGERIIFTRRGWSQAVCIGSSLEGPWQARQDAVG